MLTASAAMLDMCLLLPAAASPEEKPAARRRGAARCLFGAADAGAAELLLREQIAAERERLLWRFGFDVVAALAGEDAPELRDDASRQVARTQPLEQAPTVRRPRPSPYHRQTSVKDFYRVQKAPVEKQLKVTTTKVDPASAHVSAD